MSEHTNPGSTDRTRVKRIPERAVTDRQAMYEVLDAGLVAHVAVVSDGQPFVIPVAYARDGDRVLFHGSSASRLMKSLAGGLQTCFTVTLLDGLVCARSAFESSMNYRSVMVLGTAQLLGGEDELHALEVISEHLIPGRWSEIRHPNEQEVKATKVLALDLLECSVKIRTGPPEDLQEDLDDPVYSQVWAGVVDLKETLHAPADAPEYIKSWTR